MSSSQNLVKPLTRLIHPRLIRWMLLTGVFYLLLLLLFRLIFHWYFTPRGEQGMLAAFWMGFRYDARIVCGFLLFVYLFSLLFYFFRPFMHPVSRKILQGFTLFFGALLLLVYTFDFAHFAYLRQRLNASILVYTDDAGISLSMIWESYPVIRILLGWVLLFTGIFYTTRFIYRLTSAQPDKITRRNYVLSYLLAFFLLALGVFGRLGQFPLRWSDAYQLGSDYKASVALNPFQSFLSSLRFRHAGYELEKVKKYYPLMAAALGVDKPDSASLNFERRIPVSDSALTGKPNVVIVLCESFSAYKSSMWGNPLNTTPFFDSLCKQGAFFKNCFTPAYGTARGVWALMTSIPDVTSYKTASRNPNLVNQRTILNDLKGYEKFYFIGGSASWANIRGLLKDNVKGLHLYEQPDYSSPKVDVWGISDKNLFLEANKVLGKQPSPFFAIVQTADNHRPYTIPSEDRPFVPKRNLPKDTLEKYGFWSNEELNAYDYMDYTYRVFMQAAAREKYYSNTIFVFVGDHGIRGSAGNMLPKVWSENSLTLYHVPLLFYSPGRINPRVSSRIVSQLDVMPTLAGLTGQPVGSSSMGRNILQPVADSDFLHNHAFVLDFDLRLVGIIDDRYFYQANLQTGKDGFYPLKNNDPLPPGEPGEAERNCLQNLANGYYETARYLLFHNKKKDP